MRLKQESVKMVTVCAKKGKRENDFFFFSLFVVLMYTGYHCRECRTTNLGSKAKHLDLLLTTRVTLCTYAQFAKKSILTIF